MFKITSGKRVCRNGLALVLCGALMQGCLGAAVGTAVDVTLAVAKVPFKVAGAAVDVATPEKDDEDE